MKVPGAVWVRYCGRGRRLKRPRAVHLLFLLFVSGGGVVEEDTGDVSRIDVEDICAEEFERHFHHVADVIEAVVNGKICVHSTEICGMNVRAIGEETLSFCDVAKDPYFAGAPLENIDFVLL